MQQENSSLSGFVDAALEIARKRTETLEHLRTALENDDIEDVVKYAKDLCGIEDDKASDTTH